MKNINGHLFVTPDVTDASTVTHLHVVFIANKRRSLYSFPHARQTFDPSRIATINNYRANHFRDDQIQYEASSDALSES
jgi:hypothetical protein